MKKKKKERKMKKEVSGTVGDYRFKASRIFLAISRYCHIPPETFLN